MRVDRAITNRGKMPRETEQGVQLSMRSAINLFNANESNDMPMTERTTRMQSCPFRVEMKASAFPSEVSLPACDRHARLQPRCSSVPSVVKLSPPPSHSLNSIHLANHPCLRAFAPRPSPVHLMRRFCVREPCGAVGSPDQACPRFPSPAAGLPRGSTRR